VKRLRAGRGRYLGWTAAVVLVLAMLRPAAASTNRAYDPHEVTAAMLIKLASFIRWPADRGLANPRAPLRITVIDDLPLAHALQRLLEGGPGAERKIIVHSQRTAEDLAPAHIYFIGERQAHALEKVIEIANSLRALTAARCQGFAERGVAVNFYRIDERIRFEVNVRAIEEAGLRASYKLVSFARIVQRGAP